MKHLCIFHFSERSHVVKTPKSQTWRMHEELYHHLWRVCSYSDVVEHPQSDIIMSDADLFLLCLCFCPWPCVFWGLLVIVLISLGRNLKALTDYLTQHGNWFCRRTIQMPRLNPGNTNWAGRLKTSTVLYTYVVWIHSLNDGIQRLSEPLRCNLCFYFCSVSLRWREKKLG